MTCPQCQSSSRVIETRAADDGAAMRRRRECTSCSFRFTTFERLAATRLRVSKRNGTTQPFDAEKLRGALIRAAHKRPVTAAELSAIVDAVEAEATASGGTIASDRIGVLCLERLAQIDRGAYFQWAGTLPEITPEIASLAAPGSVRGEEHSP